MQGLFYPPHATCVRLISPMACGIHIGADWIVAPVWRVTAAYAMRVCVLANVFNGIGFDACCAPCNGGQGSN